MHKEIDIAFSLLRAVLEGTAPTDKSMEANEWWSLFRLLQKNHVAALASEAFMALPKEELPPRAVLIPWLSEQQKSANWYRHQSEVQESVIALMQRHDIKALVLKGTHLAGRYPREELREFGDLDLYFYDRHEEADNLMHQKLGVSITNDAHHHSKYNYRGVTIESHYDFLNTHYPRSNRHYEALLKELSHTNSSPKLGEVPVRAEECVPTFEVLFLLRHMACHFAASRITLRDLVDWALTCRALHDKVDWDKVNTVVNDFGMDSFVAALNTIASQRLGIQPLMDLPTHRLIDSQTQCLLERDLLYGSQHSDDRGADGLTRLPWKFHRWRANRWKRRMVFSDSETALLLASLTSHAEKPASILHKM